MVALRMEAAVVTRANRAAIPTCACAPMDINSNRTAEHVSPFPRHRLQLRAFASADVRAAAADLAASATFRRSACHFARTGS